MFPLLQVGEEGSQEVEAFIHHQIDIYILAFWGSIGRSRPT